MAEEERDRKWTVLRLRGLRKRWIVNTILPVLVLLVVPIQMGLEWCFDRCSAALERRRERREKRRRARPRPERSGRRRR